MDCPARAEVVDARASRSESSPLIKPHQRRLETDRAALCLSGLLWHDVCNV